MQFSTYGTAKATRKILEEFIKFSSSVLAKDKKSFTLYKVISLASKLIWGFKGSNIQSIVTWYMKLIS